MRWLSHLVILLIALFSGCQKGERFVENNRPSKYKAEPDSPLPASAAAQTEPVDHVIRLTDRSQDSGIDFTHFYEGHGQHFIAETIASGLATFDYDLDGWNDIYFLNGAELPKSSGPTHSDRLIRNLGHFKFADVTQQSGSTEAAHSLGIAVADYDNDGFPDAYVSNFGGNRLLHNNGDGSFAEVAPIAGVTCHGELGAGVCFFDIDADGNLDLYVGNYVKNSIEKNPVRTTEGFRSYPAPGDFEPEKDYLFYNRGDGTFDDISEQSGIRVYSGTTMGVISSDVDNDNDVDLIAVCDVDRNLLFLNDGTGKFLESGVVNGLAFSGDGKMNGNMGVDAGDYDGDGHIDLFTTTYRADFPVLYRNDGLGEFQDVTKLSRVGTSVFPHVNWGTAFADFDNSGLVDLFIANGDTDPLVSKWAYTTSWKVRNTLMRNLGGGRFSDITATAGTGMKPVECSRGVAVDDLDNDGLLDAVVLNAKAAPTVIQNQSQTNDSHWLQIELRGTSSCRDGTGCRVTLVTEKGSQVAEVYSGRGYQSSFGNRLHFGLGQAALVKELQIRWPGGAVQKLSGIPANQKLLIVQ